MRHRRRGRKLGRNPKHQRALLRNLASSLILTERDAEFDENAPKVKGRVVTTISKAKEVRPLVEKCVTIARRSLAAADAAAEYASDADRGTQEYRAWRTSEQWQKWNAAIAPAVDARRRCQKLLGDKDAVTILFDEVAPRFLERPGGYTRIIRLAKPRLGDSGTKAILEFVGVRDRVIERSFKPAFDDSADEDPGAEQIETADAELTDMESDGDEAGSDAAGEDEEAAAETAAADESAESSPADEQKKS